MASAAPIRSGGPLSLAVSSEHRARSHTKWGTCSAARRAIARLLCCAASGGTATAWRPCQGKRGQVRRPGPAGVALAIDRKSRAPARHVPRALFSADCCSNVDDGGFPAECTLHPGGSESDGVATTAAGLIASLASYS